MRGNIGGWIITIVMLISIVGGILFVLRTPRQSKPPTALKHGPIKRDEP